jgi:fatty acid desaturase
MIKDTGEIKIRYTLKQGKEDAFRSETVRTFPISRWIIYIILVPAFIALAFLISAFFFSIFFPLFLFGGITLGFWIWWLHRKLHKSIHIQSLEDEYVVIREIQVVESKPDETENK